MNASIKAVTPKFSSLIQTELKRTLQGATLFIAVALIGYAGLSIQKSAKEAETLIVEHTMSLASAAAISEDVLSIEKDVTRFATTIGKTQPFQVKIEVRLNGRLVSSVLSSSSALFIFPTEVKQVALLPGGEKLEVVAEISHGRMVRDLALSIIILVAAVFLLFRILMHRLNRSVDKITLPLAQSAKWVKQVAAGLPESAKQNVFTAQGNEVEEVTVLNQSIGTLLGEIVNLETHLAQVNFDRGRLETADYVGHNVKSPLSALSVMLEHLPELSQEKRTMIRRAVSQISDLLNTLSKKQIKQQPQLVPSPSSRMDGAQGQGDAVKTSSTQLLSCLVSDLISEKRMQYRNKLGVEIDFPLQTVSYGAFAKIHPVEFKSVLSNLVDNAVDALGDVGQIVVTLHASESQVELRVQDTGKGISPEILPRLSNRGETFGKPNGEGLGLYHARTSAESWGGTLAIESQLGKGTSVTIRLPRTNTPGWFVETIALDSKAIVVVMDDDLLIHEMWKNRLKMLDAFHRGVQLISLSSPEALQTWHTEHGAVMAGRKIQYLIDYEIVGSETTGLDAIESLQIQEQSILVTSRYDEARVRERCESLKLKRIPKVIAGLVPIALSRGTPEGICRFNNIQEPQNERQL